MFARNLVWLLGVVLLGAGGVYWLTDTAPEAPYVWSIPAHYPAPLVPADNPMSEAKVALGRYLFYDRKLAGNGKQSCADCHQQAHAFAEPLATSIGSTGELHHRNASALVNVAYNKTLTWSHPHLQEIERQVLIPMFADNPVEMGIAGHEQQVLKALARAPYPELFNAAFGDEEVNFLRVTQALASFVRSLVSFSSPFDRYAYQNDDSALSAQQLAGMELFFSERLECHHCHGGFNFTQSTTHQNQPINRFAFHNTGLYYTHQPQSGQWGYPEHDRGMIDVTLNPGDEGLFRAPTLRNVAFSAPYMHDGSIATLSEVLDFYAAGGRVIATGPLAGDGRKHPNKNQFIKGFELTEDEKQALLAFLESLSDAHFIRNKQYANPWLLDEQPAVDQ
ncbi:MbnH family di-heme enzyme [Pseudoalteromonas fenneropenaei]|uniref:MbnH family di-heme enzyme n=1 Tax=Pseudoalteromonas fenneropenaei TaxID=1737459 RepID=A0ABV7CG67_9GAMM